MLDFLKIVASRHIPACAVTRPDAIVTAAATLLVHLLQQANLLYLKRCRCTMQRYDEISRQTASTNSFGF
jgi:hypothetical protein